MCHVFLSLSYSAILLPFLSCVSFTLYELHCSIARNNIHFDQHTSPIGLIKLSGGENDTSLRPVPFTALVKLLTKIKKLNSPQRKGDNSTKRINKLLLVYAGEGSAFSITIYLTMTWSCVSNILKL